MSKEKKYVYLQMPVSFEEKRKWNAKGFRVADAAFAPEGYEPPVDEDATKKQKPKG